MKANRTVEEQFIPVCVTFETQKEINGFVAMLRHDDVQKVLGFKSRDYLTMQPFATDTAEQYFALQELVCHHKH
jgi:hypothetical protein